jgi:thymidylate synthase ThyX
VKILKNAGEFKVLATWPSSETNEDAQKVLEKAGRTCYQSEKHEIASESALKFVSNCCKRTHYSVIEHGWRGYIIPPLPGVNLLSAVLTAFWPITKFMYITQRTYGSVLISANLETWRKLLISKKLSSFSRDILNDLIKFAPAIFATGCYTHKTNEVTSYYAWPIESVDQLISDEERLTHIAHTVQYNNHSRGFTHELVRHRLPVYSQESTRYVDESDFEVVVPPHRNENDLLEYGFIGNNTTYTQAESVKNWLQMNETAYKSLREDKWRPEDARQILPTAIKAQIVMSCNLKTRRYIHYRRTSEFAHWEIRRTMCDELKYFSNLYSECFNMFEYQDKPAKDTINGYYNVNCNHEVFLNE